MVHDIHKRLIKRLALVWLGLSLVLGGGVYLFEHEKIDEYVVSLALEESKSFIEDEIHYLGDPSEAAKAILEQKSREHLASRRFVVVEFYDKDKKPISETTKPEYAALEESINALKHQDLLAEEARYATFEQGGQLYMRVVTPLRSGSGTIEGYFEGIYHVEPQTLSDINERVVLSLIQALAAIFLTTLILYPVIVSLNRGVLRYAKDLLNANIGTLEVLGNAIAKRDSDTNAHNYRVTLYSIRLAAELRIDREAMRELIKGAFLHDVGKIAISDAILLKPGKLSVEEFETMKTHVSHGADILKDFQWLQGAMDVVRSHHEKYGGRGYMAGLSGKDIPLSARIFCIADVFDALTSKRPYKEPFSFEKSLTIIEGDQGTHFDPEIVDVFLRIADAAYREIGDAGEESLRKKLRASIDAYF